MSDRVGFRDAILISELSVGKEHLTVSDLEQTEAPRGKASRVKDPECFFYPISVRALAPLGIVMLDRQVGMTEE